MSKKTNSKLSIGMLLVTIGIVYGDIGTSPLYVMKSILAGNGGIGTVDESLVLGALSLVIWTITLLTTIKYVFIALRADNHGEGGIFSLFAIVKKCGKWLVIPAMIGGSALLADGVLTPAVTVTTAIEGLRSIESMNRFLGSGQTVVLIITLAIIATLFAIQHKGTKKIGGAFGPIMLLWFSFLGICGIAGILKAPFVLRAFNPLYAIKILFSPDNKMGFLILGSVFLATTGAEALYSDMGHVGRENVYASWPFVKICLILNYLGQGSWILRSRNDAALLAMDEVNPFFEMLPAVLRPVAVILSTAAAIIASQALITGSYTLVAEAIRLDLMPHLQVRYPSDTKGQIYISTVNWILWIGCTLVVLFFKTSARMEAAYGLAITVTMLMTTLLLFIYLWSIRKNHIGAVLVLVCFGAIESVFFISSLAKFTIGGYVTVIIALLILVIMIIWNRGTELERKYRKQISLDDHVKAIGELRADSEIPYTAGNLVFIENAANSSEINRDILFSILNRTPKRAKAYWFLSIEVLDDPHALYYDVDTYGTDYIFRVHLGIGFANNQYINVYLRQIVEDLSKSGELPPQDRKYSIYGPSDIDSFVFCILKQSVPENTELTPTDETILRMKYVIRSILGNQAKWYGLESSSCIMETLPIAISTKPSSVRIARRK